MLKAAADNVGHSDQQESMCAAVLNPIARSLFAVRRCLVLNVSQLKIDPLRHASLQVKVERSCTGGVTFAAVMQAVSGIEMTLPTELYRT